MGAEALKWWEPNQEAHPPVGGVRRRSADVQLATGVLRERLMIAGLEAEIAELLLAHPENVDFLHRLVLNEFRRGIGLSGTSLDVLHIHESAEAPVRHKSGEIYVCRVKDPMRSDDVEYRWHDHACYVYRDGMIQTVRRLQQWQYDVLFEEEGLLSEWKTPSLRSIIESLPISVEESQDKLETLMPVVSVPGVYNRNAYRQPPRIPRALTKPKSQLTLVVIRYLGEAWQERLDAYCKAEGISQVFVDRAIVFRHSETSVFPDGVESKYKYMPAVPVVDWNDPAFANSLPDKIKLWWTRDFSQLKFDSMSKGVEVPANPVILVSPATYVTFFQTIQGHGWWNTMNDFTATGRTAQLQWALPKLPLWRLGWL